MLEVNSSFFVIIVQLWNEELLEHVQIHDTFHARGTVEPNTATASAPAFEIKMATFTGAERARVFWLEETKSATQVQRKFRTKYRK